MKKSILIILVIILITVICYLLYKAGKKEGETIKNTTIELQTANKNAEKK